MNNAELGKLKREQAMVLYARGMRTREVFRLLSEGLVLSDFWGGFFVCFIFL